MSYKNMPLGNDFTCLIEGVNRDLKHQTFLRSRMPTVSHYSNYVHTAHFMMFARSRRTRQNATFQVEGSTPHKYAVILFIGEKLLAQNHKRLFCFSKMFS